MTPDVATQGAGLVEPFSNPGLPMSCVGVELGVALASLLFALSPTALLRAALAADVRASFGTVL